MQTYLTLSGIGLSLLLLACSPGGDARSDADQSAAPPSAQPARPDSSVTPSAEPRAEPQPAAAQRTERATPQPARPDTRPVAAPPTLADVLTQYRDSLTSIRGVVGVDSVACNGGTCIRITVARRTQSMLASLPASVEGYQVVVAERERRH